MLKRYIIFLKKHPLITAAFAVVYAMVCIKTIRADSNFQEFILRTLLCGAMVFFLYQISGEKTLLSYTNSTWYVIKVAMGFWIFALPIGLLGLLLNAGQDAVPCSRRWHSARSSTMPSFTASGIRNTSFF